MHKVLVLGIGNLLFGDEGFGPHMIHYMSQKYRFDSQSSHVDFIDGGTLAHQLIPLITDYNDVLIVDCVSVEGSHVGDVFYFEFEEAIKQVTWQGSAHEVEMLQTLMMMKIFGDLPKITILGIVPFVIGEDSTFALSPAALESALTVEQKILAYLSTFEINATMDKAVNLCDITQTTFLRDVP